MANSDKAQSLITPIITAYTGAAAGESSALKHALECGSLLNRAMETVKADGDKWGRWRKKNLPDVQEETDKVYRRLAIASEKIEAIFADCKSIRDAIAKAAKYDLKTWELKPPKPEKPSKAKPASGSTATGQAPPVTDTPTLEQALKDKAGDEILIAISDDEEKLEEVAKASIGKLTPKQVCAILTETWEQEDIQKLQQGLSIFLVNNKKSEPSSLPKRPVGQQATAN